MSGMTVDVQTVFAKVGMQAVQMDQLERHLLAVRKAAAKTAKELGEMKEKYEPDSEADAAQSDEPDKEN